MFDYTDLKYCIKSKFKNQKNFAIAMGLSHHYIWNKLNNKCQWIQSEIIKATDLLEIPISEIPLYFFQEAEQ